MMIEIINIEAGNDKKVMFLIKLAEIHSMSRLSILINIVTEFRLNDFVQNFYFTYSFYHFRFNFFLYKLQQFQLNFIIANLCVILTDIIVRFTKTWNLNVKQ